MKKILTLVSPVLIALICSAQAADGTVKLSDVHLCCGACVKAVDAALSKVPGVTGKADRDTHTVTINGPDKAAVQKAVDTLVVAGYFGVSSDPAIKVIAESGAKDQKVQSLKIIGVHLCCNQCVKSVNETFAKVPGVKGNTAARNAESFEVTGDFNAKELFNALNKAGLAGRIGK